MKHSLLSKRSYMWSDGALISETLLKVNTPQDEVLMPSLVVPLLLYNVKNKWRFVMVLSPEKPNPPLEVLHLSEMG